MNSEKLKIKFSSEYKSFFRENSKVFSIPLTLNWASDINEEYKGVHIKQKIPLRIYLWVNKIKEKKINFNKINYFDINGDIFVNEKLVEYSPVLSELSEIFNEEYNRKNKFDHGLEINVLAESWKWQGMWFLSNLSALLIIWCKNNYKEIYKNLNISSDKPIMNYLNKDTFYDDLLRTTIKLNKIISRKISTVCQISSLFDWSFPIVSFIQGNQEDTENKNIDKIKLFWYKINSLSKNLPKVPYIPIDYGLIYTGTPVSVSQILYSNKNSLWKENKVIKNTIDLFWEDIEWLSEKEKPLFYNKFIDKKSEEEKNKAFIEIYTNLMWALSLKILNNSISFYEKPYEEYLSKKFLENLDKITRFNILTKKCSTHFRNFIYDIVYNFKHSNVDLAIAPNDTMLMWWNAVFAMKFEWNRWKLIKTIEEINKKNSWVKLVYTNWLDWNEKKWFKVEQDIENNFFSEYISKNSLVLISTNWKRKIIESDFLEKNEHQNWLFLDLTKNKISLNWEKLTSKQLKSQNTTIEVLLKLLENKWEFISNKDLTLSSYSTNKNDMSSKIISPLQKLIKSENNIDFNITITWTSSDFKMKLEESIIDINIVRYIN